MNSIKVVLIFSKCDSSFFFAMNLDKVNINFAILIIDKVLQGFKHDFSRTIYAIVLRAFNLYSRSRDSIDIISADHIYNLSDFNANIVSHLAHIVRLICAYKKSSRNYMLNDVLHERNCRNLFVVPS